MAVQAQNPSTPLPDLRNRSVQSSTLDFSSVDPRSFLIPFPYADLTKCQQYSFPGVIPLMNGQERIPESAAVTTSTPAMLQNLTVLHNHQLQTQPQTPNGNPSLQQQTGQRKRRRSSNQIPQMAASPSVQQQLVDLNQIHGCPSVDPLSGIVSTGLRLAFDDDRSTVTSSRLDSRNLTIGDEFSGQLLQQQDDIKQLLQTQVEQLRQAIEERTQRHSKALFATLEEEVTRRIRERDVELERVSKRALDLEERVKHLSMETHGWQSKAKSYESMVTVLRANLQHALIHNQNRVEQSKLLEGCGDSEADDAVSVHIDNNAEAQQSRATMMMMKKRGASCTDSSSSSGTRFCRKCGSKEATLLLLPCLHLCLCNDCNVRMDRCPVCNSAKSAYVEVYLC